MTTEPIDEEININGTSFHWRHVNGETVFLYPNRFDNGVELFSNSPENDEGRATGAAGGGLRLPPAPRLPRRRY